MGNYDFELDLDTVNTMSIIDEWISPNSNVLEFGSANGRLTKYLSQEKQCNMTIVEIDQEAGQMAAEYAVQSYIGKEQGDIEAFYWINSKEKYDYIIFADVLEHLSNPQMVIDSCKPFLKEDGRLLVSIPNVSHNSIIIDMLNDKFNYDETGLLDRTHIHFFTYNSFVEMVYACGYAVRKMRPVYSRVGNNEIRNTYQDVPIEVAKYLRKRKQGSVYQYVFNLAVGTDINEIVTDVPVLDTDEYEELETQCFFRRKDELYDDKNRIEKLYRENERVIWEIKRSELLDAELIRIDPAETSCIMQLELCVIKDASGERELSVEKTNALGRTDSFMIFDNQDPWIELKPLPQTEEDAIIVVAFRIIEYGRETEYYKRIKQILEKLGVKLFTIDDQKLEEQRIYLEHLEHLEHDIAEQKTYIEHLEHDIAELKAYIEN